MKYGKSSFGVLYIIQKSWTRGVIPEAFKLDPKIMLPKPGKSEYNSARSYRPITLESTIGKVMERVVCKRLVWKLEVEGGVASTQYAYRRQKSCVQTMLRICNSISESRNRKEYTVQTVMDFESCYERVWRAGLLRDFLNQSTDREVLLFTDGSALGNPGPIWVQVLWHMLMGTSAPPCC